MRDAEIDLEMALKEAMYWGIFEWLSTLSGAPRTSYLLLVLSNRMIK